MAKAKKEESEDVITVTAIEIIPAETENKTLSLVDEFESKLTELREQYANVVIADKASLQHAQLGVKTMTRLQNQAEKWRLEVVRPVNALLTNFKAKVDKFKLDVEEIKKPILDKINAEEIRLREQAKAEENRRVKLLTESGWTLVGQSYRVGPHNILFDSLTEASEDQLNQWVAMGNAWIESERQRIAAEQERLREIEIREAALKAQEAEMEEFRRWKAAQAGNAPAQETIQVASEHPIPVEQAQISFEDERPPVRTWTPQNQEKPESVENATQAPSFAEQVDDQAAQNTPAPIETEEQLAVFRKASISWMRTQPEARIYYNQGLNDFLRRFEAESHTKAEWVEILKSMKR